jgi:hypothetical protein
MGEAVDSGEQPIPRRATLPIRGSHAGEWGWSAAGGRAGAKVQVRAQVRA